MNGWKRKETFENMSFGEVGMRNPPVAAFWWTSTFGDLARNCSQGETLLWCSRLRAILLVQAAEFGAGWNNPQRLEEVVTKIIGAHCGRLVSYYVARLCQ